MPIFLSQDNLETVVQLPVMPEKVRINKGSQNKTIDLINIGEANFLSGNALEDITLNSWLPAEGQITGLTNFKAVEAPEFYINIIKEFQTNGKPIRLSITEINLTESVSIERFTPEISGGDGEYSYGLELKEFRAITIKEVVTVEVVLEDAETADAIDSDREDDKPVPVEVTVVSGDSLWKIAKKHLGNGSRYLEIAKLNNIKNPSLIFPGQVFLMP